jgi:hypothetical protein
VVFAPDTFTQGQPLIGVRVVFLSASFRSRLIPQIPTWIAGGWLVVLPATILTSPTDTQLNQTTFSFLISLFVYFIWSMPNE